MAVCFALLFTVCLFSACAGAPRAATRFGSHEQIDGYFGSGAFDELSWSCTDKVQLEAANRIVSDAKSVFDYIGKPSEQKKDAGALSGYYLDVEDNYFQGIDHAETKVELVTTKQNENTGFLWVIYTALYYNAGGGLVTGSSNVLSRWEIAKSFGEWKVISVKEHP